MMSLRGVLLFGFVFGVLFGVLSFYSGDLLRDLYLEHKYSDSESEGFVPLGLRMELRFDPAVKAELSRLYDDDREFKACLRVEEVLALDDDNESYEVLRYVVSGVDEVEFGKDNFVLHHGCPGFEAQLHSHPRVGCRGVIWSGDVDGAKASFRLGNVFYMVMCADDAVEVYTRENYWEGYIYAFE